MSYSYTRAASRRVKHLFSLFLALVILGIPLELVAQGAADVVNASGPMRPLTLTDRLIQLIPMFTLVSVIYYLIVLRPKVREERAHGELVASLTRGDSVVTSGGLVGKVAGMAGGSFQLEIAKGVIVEVQDSHVTARYIPAQKVGNDNAVNSKARA